METLTKPIIDAVWPKVENILKGWGIPTSLDDIVNDVKGFLSTILTPIAGLVEGALGFITDMKTTILNVISNLVMTIFDVMNDIDAAITDFRVVMVYAQAAIAGITAFLSNFSIMDLGASARKAAANASVVDVAQIAALDSGYISRVSSRGITEDSISTAIGEFNKSSNQMIDSIQSLTDAIKAGLNGTLTISNGQGTMSQHTINSRGSGVVSSANIQGSS